MKRKIHNELQKLKQRSSTKEAILIEGATHIGKSHIMQKFARNLTKYIENDKCVGVQNKQDYYITFK